VELPLPEMMSPDQWNHVTYTLILLWAFAGCMILGAGSMMVAHILVPSLIDTRDIPESYGKGRPIVYAIAAIAFAGAIFVFASFVMALSEFREIYPGVWI
jgi:TRAP-type C4-dicarboxylate transport system permease small subunit